MINTRTVRSVFWFLTLAALAVGLALLVGRNQAIVSLFWAPYRVDLSFNLVVFGLLVAFVLLHAGLRGLSALRELPAQASRWRALQTERAIGRALLEALAHQSAGRFVRAQSAAQRAVGLLQAHPNLSLPDRAQQTVLAHGVWAESAHALQDRTQRDFYWQVALEPRWSKAAPEAQEGLSLRAIQWALDENDATTARRLWTELPHRASRRIQALRLKLRLARLEGQHDEALEAARVLIKHRAYSPLAAKSLMKALVLDGVRKAVGLEQLERIWTRLSGADQSQSDLVLAIATQAATLLSACDNETDSAACARRMGQWLQPVWERWSQLDAVQQQRLVLVLEQAMPFLGGDWLARVEQTQGQWPQQATLQFLAGQACLQRRLWGKAQLLLTQASQGLQDNAMRRRAWCSLAQLAHERGDKEAEQLAWKTAALIP